LPVPRTIISVPNGLAGRRKQRRHLGSGRDPAALAAAVATLAGQPEKLAATGMAARTSYEKYFSTDMIREQLRAALTALSPPSARG